jgi:hypothetical protein
MAAVYDEYVEPILKQYLSYEDEEHYAGNVTYFRVFLRQSIGPFQQGFFFNNISFDFNGTNPIPVGGSIPVYVPKLPPDGLTQVHVHMTNPALQDLEEVLGEEFPYEEVPAERAEGYDVDVDLTQFWKIRINVTVETT